jgi:hypothetical protein
VREWVLLFALLVGAAGLLMLESRVLALLLYPLTMDGSILGRVSLAVSRRSVWLFLAVVD